MSDEMKRTFETRSKTLIGLAIFCSVAILSCVQVDNETVTATPEEEVPAAANPLIGTAQEILEAFNADDWEAFKTLMTDDAVYEEVGTSQTIKGVDSIIEQLKGWKGAMPDVKGTVDNLELTEKGVLLEVTWTGTNTGPLVGPHTVSKYGPEGFPATGKVQTTRAAWVLEFDGPKLSRSRHYFDMLSFMKQLGVIE